MPRKGLRTSCWPITVPLTVFPNSKLISVKMSSFFATGGNLGYGTAINRAVQHLKERKERGDIDGDFFVVSNPDVVFDPGSIDAMLECAQRWPGAATIGPRIREADGAAYPSARTVPTIRNGVGHALFGTIWPSNPWTKAYRDDDDLTTEHPAGWLPAPACWCGGMPSMPSEALTSATSCTWRMLI